MKYLITAMNDCMMRFEYVVEANTKEAVNDFIKSKGHEDDAVWIEEVKEKDPFRCGITKWNEMMDQRKEIKIAWAHGEIVQHLKRDMWVDWKEDEYINVGKPEQWRVKPKTISINGFDVPEPLREIPDGVKTVYAVDLAAHSGCTSIILNMDGGEWAIKGLLHSSRESAEMHAKALLSFTKQP